MVQFSQEARVQSAIGETLQHISEFMGMESGGSLSRLVKENMEALLDTAAEQYAALQEVKNLTGKGSAKVNIEDIRYIDPGQYKDPGAVARAIDAVARLEARKLLLTSDFISDVKRKHVNDLPPDAVSEAGSELRAARQVVGKAIKGCITTFSQFKERPFSVSHMPDAFMKAEVQPLREKMRPFLPSPPEI
ncbi:MAG: hypothetical protein H6862_01215 [Rhodospirillales bacterium]|nr:hypothetical protein [Rhodospirillales bacterium]